MKKAFEAYINNRITRVEMYRYQELKKKLMGNDSFVEIEDTKEWREFNNLTKKIIKP